ncbi:auxin-responsive protein SAUR36-like [Corylus avellana]|uniref:auxin-responsive protein SAUR36-like n=1 Tax=Corylus avellana TaxID=13451 RepID=UPI00286C8D1D|nr:auxin-responsive protein SAUR36-like [Corylus avellana]
MYNTIKRKIIVQAAAIRNVGRERCSSLLADKGHFVVYTADQRRFMIPLLCLNTEIFRELLKLSEEEFGLPRDRPLTLSCDAIILEYIVTIIQRQQVQIWGYQVPDPQQACRKLNGSNRSVRIDNSKMHESKKS